MTDGAPPGQPPPFEPGSIPPSPPDYEPYGYGTRSAPVSDFGPPLAEWWKRLVALLIDGVVVGVPVGIVFAVLLAAALSQASIDPETGEIRGGGGALAGSLALGYALVLIAPVVYHWLLNGSQRGQTVGKIALKIQVRDAATGGPVGMGRGLLREVVRYGLGLLTCGIGGILNRLWPLWDEKRQALHDKAVRSVVVDLT
jgi:uncharacterized RDD family membrane protein YckC